MRFGLDWIILRSGTGKKLIFCDDDFILVGVSMSAAVFRKVYSETVG